MKALTDHLSDNLKWLGFAWQNTLRNRRRSAVTASIAALGTAAILLAGGFALYTYESLAQAAARDSGPRQRPPGAGHPGPLHHR